MRLPLQKMLFVSKYQFFNLLPRIRFHQRMWRLRRVGIYLCLRRLSSRDRERRRRSRELERGRSRRSRSRRSRSLRRSSSCLRASSWRR